MDDEKKYYVIVERESDKEKGKPWNCWWENVLAVTDRWFEAVGKLRHLIVVAEEEAAENGDKIIEEKEMEQHSDNESFYNIITCERPDGCQYCKMYSIFECQTIEKMRQSNIERQ